MNKSILEALMRLFAIIADTGKEELSGRARAIVSSYLKRQFSQDLVSRYLIVFDKYLDKYHKTQYSSDYNEERDSVVNSMRVLQICRQINEELQQEQKVIVLVELFEFARENYELTQRELSFIEMVATTFKISKEEFEDIKLYCLTNSENLPSNSKFLIISNKKQDDNSDLKYIYVKGLEGIIFILRIVSTNTYVFRYLGKGDIYFNMHNVKANRSYVFPLGSVIKGSKFKTIYYGNIVSKFIEGTIKSKVIYIAKDVEYKFRDGVVGLHRFDFVEESGKVVGIMGGSGVGKSTLLNVLNGNYPISDGKITINNYDIHTNTKELKGVIGYVPQDDLLIEELTVFQNLFYNAKLCFRNLNDAQITELVDRALLDFDLVEARNLQVGDPVNKIISGGQRKRVNIALELIREPSVLFVDEPTSGLSSVDAEKVMNLLKRQTFKGRLVIANIHQPSSDIFKLLDRLVIMDKGGRIVFNGNPIDANVYFKTLSNHVDANERECPTCGNVNPEESLRIVEARMVNEYGRLTRIRKVQAEEWHAHYQEQIEPKKKKLIAEKEKEAKNEKLPENNFKIPRRFTQFLVFAKRNIVSKLVNKQYLLITFLEAPVLAYILGYFTKFIIGSPENPALYIFNENKNFPAYLFMSIIVALFFGLTVSADEIIKDRRILKREKFLNLSSNSYLLSKVMVLFLISAIQTISFVLVGNMVLEIKEMTYTYWIVLFSTSCFANLLGLNISASLNSVVNIYVLVPFVLVPQILLSGVIINFNDLYRKKSEIYVPVAGDIMTSRWAYEALAVQQFKANKYSRHFFEYDKQISNDTWCFAYLIPKLQTYLHLLSADKLINDADKSRYATVLRNELNLLQSSYDSAPCLYTDSIDNQQTPQNVLDSISVYLEKERISFIAKKNKASMIRDKAYEKMLKKMGKEKFNELKISSYNKYLEIQLRNKADFYDLMETPERILRRKDPIYMEPDSKMGRAHFYSPVKKIGDTRIDTFVFNLLIIWLFNVMLYITLYFRVLRKMIKYFEKRKPIQWIFKKIFMRK